MTKAKSPPDSALAPAASHDDHDAVHRQATRALRSGDFDFALRAVERGEASIPEMVEDLKIYQAELEVQNEELRHSQTLTEHALRRFSALFNSLPLPALVVDDVGVILECNDIAEQTFGLEGRQLRSHFLPRLIKKQDHARFRRAFEQARDGGEATLREMGMACAGGGQYLADLHVSRLTGLHETAPQYAVMIVDQTQMISHRASLEQNRRHFAAYFDDSPVGMASTSLAKEWIEVNGRLCDLLGYSRHELLQKTWIDLTHPDDREEDIKQFNRALAGEIDRYELDKRFIRKDGQLLHAHVATACLRRPDGTVDYFVKLVEDITARKQAEAALDDANRKLQAQATQLRERVKELRAIYAISKSSQQKTDKEDFLAEVLNLLPSGMLYPEDAVACINLLGEEYACPRAAGLQEKLTGEIMVDGHSLGQVSVGYLRTHAVLDDGPFMREEQIFVEGVAELVGRFLERLHREQERQLSSRRNLALLELTTRAPELGEKDLLSFALEHAEQLTCSKIGYVHFVNPDQETITLGTWSANTLLSCQAAHDSHYPISQAGVWADCFRQKRSVIHNDYQAAENRRGLPQGHAALTRHISVPVITEGKVRMIFGVGNKQAAYDEGDLNVLERLAYNTWALLERNRLTREMERAAQVFKCSREAVMIVDDALRILSVNAAFTQITGYAESEVLGQTPSLLKSGLHDQSYYRDMWARINGQGHWQGEIWNRRKNGELYPQWLSISTVVGSDGAVSDYIGVFMDISEQKAAQQRIEHLANHDPLTDLPNRTLLRDRFDRMRASAERQSTAIGLLYLDLDHFKNVNDSLGHPIGDRLLVEAAQRLSTCVRDTDTVSRLGGDEFVILVNDIRNLADLGDVARKLLQVCSEAFHIENSKLMLSSSIGISMFPNDGRDFDVLLQRADTALYQAKGSGRNTYKFFEEEMNQQVAKRMLLETRMREGFEQNQFYLMYQPQFEFSTGRLIGVESLIRWRHPELGLVAPVEFVPVAEDSDLIIELGNFVLDQACKQADAWYKAGKAIKVAVNVSALQFTRGVVEQSVKDAIEKYRLPAHLLELELTESILVSNPDSVLKVVDNLRALGVRFAIDDFGTGYSSLSYLKRFNVDKLKIDQSFIRDIPGDKDDEVIVATIVNLARSLGIACIAEGVETEEQATFLKALGCNECQGYLTGKPMLPGDIPLDN